MVIHNVMEEPVLKIVDETCDDDEASENPKYSTSLECRMDTTCFVLNRIQQRYVSSARGQAHTDLEIESDRQLFVDIVTLAHEGLRRVSSHGRAFYGRGGGGIVPPTGPQFYLPTIKGRLFNGLSFELIVDVSVHLLLDNEPAVMLDNRWQNPYEIVSNTAGTYLFWPAPIPAETDSQGRTFEFEVRVEADGFDPLHHFFALERNASAQIPDALEISGEHRLPDLYLLPRT
jgi:competence protein ComFB